MQSMASWLCQLGALVFTALAILAFCFGGLSLGFQGDPPLFVYIFAAGLGLLMLAAGVLVCCCGFRKKHHG